MPQSFDDTFLGNANVPRSGGEDVQTVSSPSGSGTDADGTESPRVNTQTMQAAINSTPSGGKDQTGAQHFNGDSV